MQVWDDDEDDSDVLLLAKQFMHSDRLSQQPSVVFPFNQILKLGRGAPTAPNQRNVLAQKAKDEYLKTSLLIEQHPWSMHKAAAHLRDLVAQSDQMASAPHDVLPGFGELLQIEFVANSVRATFHAMLPHEFEEWYRFAPLTPKAITVDVTTRKRRISTKSEGNPKRKAPRAAAAAAVAPAPAAAAAVAPAPAAEAEAAAAIPIAADEVATRKRRISTKSEGSPKRKAPRAAAAAAVAPAPAAAAAVAPAPAAEAEAAAATPIAADEVAELSELELPEPPMVPDPAMGFDNGLGCKKCAFALLGCAQCKGWLDHRVLKGVSLYLGCSRCRWSRKGCTTCRDAEVRRKARGGWSPEGAQTKWGLWM